VSASATDRHVTSPLSPGTRTVALCRIDTRGGSGSDRPGVPARCWRVSAGSCGRAGYRSSSCLGPTAYLFATDPDGPESASRRVVGGHALGVAAGLVAYHLVAGDVTLTAATGPGTLASLRLAVSGVVAVRLTTVGMLATDTGHAPACATTLIVSLGILSSPLEGAVIVLAVVVLLVEHGFR